jgi:hypothetical protein
MFEKPTKVLMSDLQRFVFRHKIFVEAREFDDGLIFLREPKGRTKKFGHAGTSRCAFGARNGGSTSIR